MQIAIVGLAGSGKTTVFNTLTRGHAETGGYGGVTLNVGVVKVPDPRLDALATIFKPKKIVRADVTYVDMPAPPPSTEGHPGTEELPAEHLARSGETEDDLQAVRGKLRQLDPAGAQDQDVGCGVALREEALSAGHAALAHVAHELRVDVGRKAAEQRDLLYEVAPEIETCLRN